jgi:DNA ligase-1
MSLNAALEFFKEIANIKGTTAKMDTLRLAGETEKNILAYALDPYRMYGVKNFRKGGSLPEGEPLGLFETLDRMASRELSGGRAQAACQLMVADGVPEELLLMILNKDLRCGLAATSVNKVFPKLIPEFKVALAEEYEDDGVWPKLGSTKYDGLRGLAFVTEEGVTFKTRNGLEITSVDHLHDELMALPWTKGLVIDGEIKLRTGHFQDSSGAARKKSENNPDLVFYMFDWLPIQEFLNQKAHLYQWARVRQLAEWGGSEKLIVVEHTELKNDSEAQRLYEKAREAGEEGLILKNPDRTYEFRRSTAWVKMKDVKSADARVKGLIPGKGKYAGKVGALVVDFEGKDNSVGSGLSDEERQLWQDNPDLILGKMVEVNYHELTKDGNMRHSRFNKIRWDKE